MRSDQQVIPGALDKVTLRPVECRAIRHRLGLRQREMAALLGVRPATISQWERSRGCGGPAMALLLLLGRHPGVLNLLGVNYPEPSPVMREVRDGGSDL